MKFVAVVKSENVKSGKTLEYLYFDGNNRIIEESRKVALSPNIECAILCYRTIFNDEYVDCIRMFESGELTFDDVTKLLN